MPNTSPTDRGFIWSADNRDTVTSGAAPPRWPTIEDWWPPVEDAERASVTSGLAWSITGGGAAR